MACFLVPMVQAVATTIYRRANEKSISSPDAAPLKRSVPTLEKMLWGGTVMLIVDHIINSELTWRFPFFTAFNEVGGAKIFLNELLSVGVPMSLALTVFWVVWTWVSERRRSASRA